MPSRLNTEMEKEVQVFTNKLKLRYGTFHTARKSPYGLYALAYI